MLEPMAINGIVAIAYFVMALLIAYAMQFLIALPRRAFHATRASWVREIAYSAVAITTVPLAFMVGCALQVFVFDPESYMNLAEQLDEFSVWSVISIVTLVIGAIVVEIARQMRSPNREAKLPKKVEDNS
jgi:lysylphosphatidylglycerol synthetase-like protein (DUF2156 family)